MRLIAPNPRPIMPPPGLIVPRRATVGRPVSRSPGQPIGRGIASAPGGGGGGGGPADLLTGLYEVWEADGATSNSLDGEIMAKASGGLYWQPNNFIPSVTGLLNGGPNGGAMDMSSSSGSYRVLLSGTDPAHDTNAKKSELFGCGAIKRSASYAQWIYPTVDLGTSIGTILSVSTAAETFGLQLRYYGSAHPTQPGKLLIFFPGVANSVISSVQTIGVLEWNLCAWAWDNDTGILSLWLGVGGTLYGPHTATPDAAPLTSTSQVHMTASDSSGVFKGRFYCDQTALWTGRAIGTPEVLALYAGGAGILHTNWT